MRYCCCLQDILKFYNILSRWSFLTVYNIKLDAFAFCKRFKPVRLNSGMMHKDIFTLILLDKAKPFCIIKPLYCSLCHFGYSCL